MEVVPVEAFFQINSDVVLLDIDSDAGLVPFQFRSGYQRFPSIQPRANRAGFILETGHHTEEQSASVMRQARDPPSCGDVIQIRAGEVVLYASAKSKVPTIWWV